MHLICFDTIPSTNQYCELLDLSEYEEFTVIAAKAQTAGIGQKGNHWESQPGKNLTFSIILKPTFLVPADQYQLTKAISLGITDWLKTMVPASTLVHIKWPNDIYVGLNKICGTLISTKINSQGIATAIAGIGMNINQTSFPDWVPNPISLQQITGRAYDTDQALDALVSRIIIRYEKLRTDIASPDIEYLQQLLFLGEEKEFIYQSQPIRATIEGVNRFGHLMLTTSSGENITCQMKEIKFFS